MHLEHLDLTNLSNLEHLNLTNLSDLEHLDLTGLSALRALRFFHKFGVVYQWKHFYPKQYVIHCDTIVCVFASVGENILTQRLGITIAPGDLHVAWSFWLIYRGLLHMAIAFAGHQLASAGHQLASAGHQLARCWQNHIFHPSSIEGSVNCHFWAGCGSSHGHPVGHLEGRPLYWKVHHHQYGNCDLGHSILL